MVSARHSIRGTIMEFDIKTSADSWDNIAELARDMEDMGASGLLFTEAGQTPWMMITAAAMAAPSRLKRPILPMKPAYSATIKSKYRANWWA